MQEAEVTNGMECAVWVGGQTESIVQFSLVGGYLALGVN